MPMQAIEILSGAEASRVLRAESKKLRFMLEREADETWEIPRALRFRLRARLRNAIKSISDGFGGSLSRTIRPLLDWLYPPDWFFSPTREEELSWAFHDSEKILAANRFVCARADGEIVGIGAYKLGGRWSDGRDVYELAKAYIFPPFRRGWLYARLQNRAIEEVRSRDPTALIMVFSKHPAVIAQLQRLKWTPLSLADYSAITRRIGRSGIAPEARGCFSHWRGFLWDPSEKRSFVTPAHKLRSP